MCQNLLSGEAVWENESFPKGPVTIADGRLICVDEDSGAVLLAEASTKTWRELARLTPAPQSAKRALKGKVWSLPVVSGGRLYQRDQENLSCYDLQPPESARHQ